MLDHTKMGWWMWRRNNSLMWTDSIPEHHGTSSLHSQHQNSAVLLLTLAELWLYQALSYTSLFRSLFGFIPRMIDSPPLVTDDTKTSNSFFARGSWFCGCGWGSRTFLDAYKKWRWRERFGDPPCTDWHGTKFHEVSSLEDKTWGSIQSEWFGVTDWMWGTVCGTRGVITITVLNVAIFGSVSYWLARLDLLGVGTFSLCLFVCASILYYMFMIPRDMCMCNISRCNRFFCRCGKEFRLLWRGEGKGVHVIEFDCLNCLGYIAWLYCFVSGM